jgi:hypothetical protein
VHRVLVRRGLSRLPQPPRPTSRRYEKHAPANSCTST